MDLRLLRYFLAVVEEGNITAAAEYLGISQPALSRQIKELESRLGQQLFKRGNHAITLTAAGVTLRDRAREILLLADRTETEIADMNRSRGGTVYIGAAESDGFRLLAKAAKTTLERHPGTYFQLFSGNGEAVTRKLEAGLLDFALLFEPTDTTKYSYITMPTADQWGLLMRRDSQLAAQSSISIDDLIGLPLLVSMQTRFDREFSSWGDLALQDLTVVGSYNLLFNASLFVSEGCGYALCPDGIINASGKSDLTFRPLKPQRTTHMNLVWKSDRRFSPAARAYLSILRELLSSQTDS